MAHKIERFSWESEITSTSFQTVYTYDIPNDTVLIGKLTVVGQRLNNGDSFGKVYWFSFKTWNGSSPTLIEPTSDTSYAGEENRIKFQEVASLNWDININQFGDAFQVQARGSGSTDRFSFDMEIFSQTYPHV